MYIGAAPIVLWGVLNPFLCADELNMTRLIFLQIWQAMKMLWTPAVFESCLQSRWEQSSAVCGYQDLLPSAHSSYKLNLSNKLSLPSSYAGPAGPGPRCFSA